jgi:hypothetical protein
LDRDAFSLGATTGCGWHWLFAQFTKCVSPREGDNRPIGEPIAILYVKGYHVKED